MLLGKLLKGVISEFMFFLAQVIGDDDIGVAYVTAFIQVVLKTD